MWTPESLSRFIRTFRETRELRRERQKRLDRRRADVETVEPRIMLSIAQAVDHAAPDVRTALATASHAATPAPAPSQRPLVFVDPSVAATARLPDDADVVTLRADTDVLQQITRELATRRGVKSVHIVSHGASGTVRLAGQDVVRQDLFEQAGELRRWRDALADDAVINLYGCDVAEGDTGRAFVDALSRLTAATVAASDDDTGPESLGGDSTLEYVAGNGREVARVLSAESFGQILSFTITPSAGTTTHLVGGTATVIDSGLTVASATTATSGSVTIGTGYRIGEDTLDISYPGFSGSFNPVSGVLTITSGLARNASEWQAAFRAVTFDTADTAPNLSTRSITFAVGASTSAAKSLTPDLTVDEAMQTRIVEALNVVQQIGVAIGNIAGTPGSGNDTEVPFTGGLKVKDLLYPNSDSLDSNGNPVPNLSASVQPQGIGAYLSLKDAAETYFNGIGLTNDLSGFISAIQARMAAIVPGTSATRTVTANWTKPAASDARSLALTFTIANTRGSDVELSLPDLERDLGMYLPTPPTITVGGGADISFTITLDLQGHTYGSTLAQNKTTLGFTRLNSLAGFSFSNVTTTAEFGLIRGQIVNGSGVVGAKIPVTFSGASSRTLDNWATDGSNVSGFSASITGSASLDLPVSASIGGVSATTASSKIVVNDNNIFDSTPASYTTTDFSKLLYFGTLKMEDVLQEILKVKDLYATLSSSGEDHLGVQVPFLKDVTAGELMNLADLFDSAIADKVDLYEPVLNTPGRDSLLDWRLPISDDSQPKAAYYSDLLAGFSFGVVINNAWPVRTITVPADATRNTLDDLVADINAALTSANVSLTASNRSGKISFKASSLTVQKFAFVPVAPPAAQLSPTAPAGDLSSLTLNTAYYYTVTGTTTGSVTGTNYYSVATPVAAAAVHAGILAAGQTGIVKVTRVGNRDVFGSNRKGITSADGGNVNAYLVESGVNDIRRLGITDYDAALSVLEQFTDGRIRATLPMQANLGSAGELKLGNGTTTYNVTVADNNRTTLADVLADVNAALVSAGIAATDATARLVTADGVVLDGAPDGGTDYYLELHLPEGTTWSSLTLAPVSDASAFRTVALGFVVGDVSAQPRPAALRTFEDFANGTLFPSITISPVYDAANDKVTLQFSASTTATPTVAAEFDFAARPLGRVVPSNESLTFTPNVTASIDFGLEFLVKPSNPITIASGTAVPANGRLSGNATFELDFVLQDKFTVTVPSAWTSTNADVQDLVSDVNRALKAAVPTGGGTVDLTSDRLVARRQGSTGQFELTTATPVAGAATLSPTHSSGVLSNDLSYAFTHDGVDYVITLGAAATTGNTKFGDLVAQLNEALSLAVIDADGDDLADADELTASLAGKVFFTTIADGTVAGDSNVYLFSSSASSAWPSTISLSAARTDKAVTELGFDDNGSGDVSSTVARAGGATAVLKNHTNGNALASGTVTVSPASFAGSVQYGFNTLEFAGTSAASVSIGAAMSLKAGVSVGTSAAGSNLSASFDRTLTSASGTGNATATLTLTDITNPAADDVDDNATITISIADVSDTTATVEQSIGVPIPVPQAAADGKLNSNAAVNFLYNGAKYTVTVNTVTAASNTTFAQLAAQFNSALSSVTRTVAGVPTSSFDASELFTIKADGGQLVVSALVETANPDFATASFLPGLSAFGQVGLQGAFGPSTVAAALMDVLPVLDSLQAGLDLYANVPLPLINARVNELIDIKGSLARRVDAFRDMTVSSPEQIASALAAALSVPANFISVAFDDANSAYRIDVRYETGIATAKSLDMTLGDYFKFAGANLPQGLTRFVDQAGKSPLKVKMKSTAVLSVGIDLTDPNNPRTFLYGYDSSGSYGLSNGTSVKLDIEATADNISFTQSFGLFNSYISGGVATLAGPVEQQGGQNVYEYDDQKKQLLLKRESSAATLTTTLAAGKHYLVPVNAENDARELDNWSAAFAGSAEVNLPLFAPTEFSHPFAPRSVNAYVDGVGDTNTTVAGNVLTVRVPDLGQYASDVLADATLQAEMAQIYSDANGSPSPAQQQQIDARAAAIEALKENGAVEAYAPDVMAADGSTRAPTVLDVIRDPSLLVAGIDTFLGGIESGLRLLDNLNIPVIGPVLGSAVDNVFSFRNGWLQSLKHDLRGAGEGAFEALKENVFDFLGPNGIDLLLKDNGISSVDGLIPADSPDDVTLDFLDEDGEKMTGFGGFGADAVEFKVRLGQKLLDTGADLSFNFDSLAPAFTLGIDGGLTFKLGWSMTLGFGLSVTKGFYVVVDSAPTANEIELRFEAGLKGRQDGFTVVTNNASPTGYSIKDAGGNWVYGPRKGDGTYDQLHVMPVNENGQNVGGSPTLPDAECEDDDLVGPASSNAKVYWVVAANNGSGTWVPAYIDKLGFYRPMAGADWQAVNGGSSSRNPDKMVQYNQTAPFSAFGSLFMFNLTAVDQIRTGLQPKGDAEYFYDPSKASTVTSYGRNNAANGVNRNNTLPTRIAGRIAVDLVDPSSASGDYVARPGPSPTGFVLFDGTTALGGQPVLDDAGQMIPVRYDNGTWYRAELVEGGNPLNSGDYENGDEITADESENRLTLTELNQAELSDVIKLKLNAEAVVNLSLTLKVSDNANIPRLTADFNLDWRSDSKVPPPNPFQQSDQEKLDLIPEVGINNIRLDLGSFLTKLIKPIAEKIDSTIKPIDPLISALQTKIPVISDIAGRDIKLTTLLVTFGGPKGQAIGTLIEMVILVRQLSGVMAAVPSGANVYLPIGNFWLAKVGAGPLGQPGMGKQIYYDNSEVSAPSITQRNQSMIADSAQGANSVTNALGKLDQLDRENGDPQPGISNKSQAGGFRVPILQDPMTIFKLMMGEDVPLVTFSLPTVDFSFNADIPLIKIFVLEVGLRLGFQVRGQLHMGYDTYGIRLFADSKDPLDFLHGFYVSDRANADGTGADVDEFYMRATIALYGGIDLYLAKAGIEGGLTLTASVNLNDPNNDGKLRVMEAVELVKYTGNPLDLADLSLRGEVYARYYYWVGLKIWTPWKTYKITLASGGKTFARMTIFSLSRDGSDGPPVFAAKVNTVDAGGNNSVPTLLLHTGPNASKRVSNQDPLKTKDGAERIKIWNDSPGSKTVRVQYLNYSNSETQTFTGVDRVVISGGVGDDDIDASGLQGLPVEIDGGTGNDTIRLGSGHATTESLLKGGAGNDTIIVSGGGNLRIEGDDGNDTITAGNGKNTIDGGAGNDTINGGGSGSENLIAFKRAFGVDSVNLNANAIANVLSAIESTLPVTGTLGGVASTIYAGETNRATFSLGAVTEIIGSDGRDTFNLTNPTTRNANAGKGLIIRGGPGVDAYNVVGDDLSNVASDGITIDDGIRPSSTATLGTPVIKGPCKVIKSIPIAGGGLGYATAPEVVITDSSGTGARAVAGIDDKGRVTGVYILDGGENYTNPVVALVEDVSRGDSLTFSSTTTGAVVLDRSNNGGRDDYRLSSGGKAIKFVGWTSPGTTRPQSWNYSETDNVTVKLPAGTLDVQADLDLLDTFTVNARRMTQSAAITADTVKITVERGLQVNNPIQTTNNGDITLQVTGKNLSNYDQAIATATATVADGAITGFTVTNPGAYYDFAPTVAIIDDRGYGARAVATINGSGQVTGITLLDGGFGYLSTPAPRVVIAPPASLQLRNNLSTSGVGSVPGTGDGRGQVTLRADLGAINNVGEVFFPTGSNIEFKHGDFRYKSTDSLDDITPSLYASTLGGQGATATAVLDADGRIESINVVAGGSGYSSALLPTVLIEGAGEATAIVNGSGQISGFKITNRGYGYPSAPQVTILPNGFGKIVGADAGATALNRSHIKSASGSLVAVSYYGVGDPAKPIKTDVARMVAQTLGDEAGIHVLEKDGVRLGKIDNVNGINTIDGNVSVTTFAGTIHLGQPVQAMNSNGNLLWEDAAKTIPLYVRDDNGNIIYEGGRIQTGIGQIKLTADDVDVNSFIGATGGQLIVQPVKFDAPIGLHGTRARATLNISNGQISGTNTLWSGRGYTTPPMVIINPPGQRAFGTATVVSGEVTDILVTFEGKGYNADFPPTITLIGGGQNGQTPANPATATAVYDVNGRVTGVTITDGGAGYYSVPEVRFSLPGVQATAEAVVIDGKVAALTILNPGANYPSAPTVEIQAPYAFSLEAEEVAYLEEGFKEVIIGRDDGSHTFHAAAAEFKDATRLRAPRTGGNMQVESLSVEAGPVVIVGSGHTLNMTSAAPVVTGTFVEVDDNIVIHDNVNAQIIATTGHVTVFGVGKGKIDGVAGSQTENLTITDVGNVTVTGAIGSTHPIHDLTINSSGPGDIALQQSVTIDGDLHIIKGRNITFGGNVSVSGNIIIDEGASVSFNGTVTVGGNLTISKATTVSFAQNVSVSGNVLMGNASDPSMLQAVTFGNNARFDVDGTVAIYASEDISFGNRVGNTLVPNSVTLRSDTGSVSFAAQVFATGGSLTVQKALDVTFGHDVTAATLSITASGETRFSRAVNAGTLNVISQQLVVFSNQLNISTGNATITSDEVDFAGGTSSVKAVGSAIGNAVLTVKPYTIGRDIAVGSPPAVFDAMDISDTDLAALSGTFAQVNLGDAAAGTGVVTIGSIGTQQGGTISRLPNSTAIFGGTVNVVQGVDMALASGTLTLQARTGNITVDAAINGTALERGSVVRLNALVGAIAINQPVHATSQVQLLAGTTVTEGASGFISTSGLRVTAGGAVTLLHASNAVTTVAMNVANALVQFREDSGYAIGTVDGVSGISAGTGDVALTTIGGATVTQTQPIISAGLLLQGTNTIWTLTNAANDINTLAANTGKITLADVDDYTIGTVQGVAGITVSDDITLTSGTNLAINAPIVATGNGDVSITSTGGSVSSNASGDITAAKTISLSANSGMNLAGDLLASDGGLGLTVSAGDFTLTAQATSTAGNVNISASGAVEIDGAVRTVNSGNVTVTSTAADIYLSGAGDITSAGTTTVQAQLDIDSDGDIASGGNVSVTSTAATVRLDGPTAATVGAVSISGQNTVTVRNTISAGGSGGNVSVTSVGSAISLTSSADTTAGGTLTLTAATGIDTDADLTAAGVLGATTTNGTLDMTGQIRSTGASVTLQSGGDVVLGGSVEAATVITGTAGAALTSSATLTAGTNVTLDSVGNLSTAAAIDAGGDVLLTADGTLSQTAAVDADGAVTMTAASTLTTTGAVTAAGEIAVTGSTVSAQGAFATTDSDITFTGPVTLTADLTTDTGAGPGTIEFVNTIDGAHDLSATAGTGNVLFGQAVGSTTPLASITVVSAERTTFEAASYTTGVQSITSSEIHLRDEHQSNNADITYAGVVRLTSDARFDTQGGNLLVNSITGTFNDLVIETAGGTATVTGDAVDLDFVTLHDDDSAATGSIAFQGNFAATRVITVGRAYNVSFTGDSTSVSELATFLNTGTLTLGDASTDTLEFASGLTAAGSATNPSTIYLAGTLQAFDAAVVLGPIVLTADSAVDTAGTGGDITFASTIDGAFNLRLDAGTEQISIAGAVGGTTALGAVTIDSHNGLLASASVRAQSLAQVSGGATTEFDGSIETTGAGGINLTGTNFVFDGSIDSSGGGSLLLDASGTVDFNDVVDIAGDIDVTADGAATFSDDVVAAGSNGITITAASLLAEADVTANAGAVVVTTGGDATVQGSISSGDVTLTATGHDITVGGTISTTGAIGLDVDGGSFDAGGNISISGNGKLDVNVTGLATFDGTISTASADGASITAADIAFNNSVTTTNGGGVTIQHTGSLTIAAAADFNLDGPFLQNGTGAVATAGDITTTGDTVTFDGPVVLTGDVAIATADGTVSFNNTLDGNTAATRDLTITAGTGNVLFAAGVGVSTRLGDVTVVSATDLTLTADFAATTFSQVGGAGVTSIQGELNTSAPAGVSVVNNAIEITAAGGIVTNDGNAVLNAQAGAFTMSDGARLITGNGTIDIDAVGDITITGVSSGNATADAIRIASTGGAIIDGGNTRPDLTAAMAGATVTLTASGTIGMMSALDTDITRLVAAVSTEGGIFLTNAGDIEVASATTPKGMISVASGGTLTVTLADTDDGNAEFNATDDVVVGTITATTDVVITAQDGEILDTGVSGTDGVTGASVLMTARNGVGTFADPVDVKTAALVVELEQGGLPSDGDIYVRSTGIDANAGATATLSAGEGTIDIAHAGSIDLDLTATTVEGQINATVADGTLTATSVIAGGNGNVSLATTTAGKAVLLGNVTAAESSVVINSAGDIAELGSDVGDDVTAGVVFMEAAGVIGESLNPIELNVGVLSAHASGGGIFLSEVDSVTVTNLVASGDITIAAGDTILLNSAIPIRSNELVSDNDAASRNITFLAPVQLLQDTEISTGLGGGDIRFAGTVTGSAHQLSLIAGNGDITFDAAVANVSLLDIVRANDVTVSGDLSVGSGGLALTATGTVTLDGDTTIAGSATFDINNAGDTGTLLVNGDFTAGGDLTVDHDGLASFADGITFDIGGDTQFTGTGEVRFGDVTYRTGGDITFDTAPVVLTSNTVIDTGAGGGDVTFRQPVSGDYTLTVLGSGGTVVFEQAAGTPGSPLRALTITDAGTVRFDQGVNISGDLNVDATGSVDFNAALDVEGAIDIVTGGSVAFDEGVSAGQGLAVDAGGAIDIYAPVTVTSGLTDLAHGGTLHVHTGATLDLAGGLHSRGPGAVVIDGVAINTTGGDVRFDSAVTITGDLPIETQGGDIAFYGTLNGAHQVTLTAGSGDITLGGRVGGVTPIRGLTASGADIDINAAVTTATGGDVNLTAGGDVWIGAAGDISTGGDFFVTAGGTFGAASGFSLTARDGSDIVITSEDIAIGPGANAISGTGLLVIQPLSVGRSMVIGTPDSVGSPAGALNLSATEIDAIDDSFVGVLFGRGRAGGYDSGNDGVHNIIVHDAEFRTDVTIRAAASGGLVVVAGDLIGAGNADVNIYAGDHIVVEGSVRAMGTGYVTLNADADNNGNGGVSVAGGAQVRANSGDVILLGNGIEVGTRYQNGALVTSREGSVNLRTTTSLGQIFVWQRESEISAGIDVLIGSPDQQDASPTFVRLEGNFLAGRHIRAHGGDAMELFGFRFRSRGLLNIQADGNLTAIDGTAISHGGKVVMQADADATGTGVLAESDVRRSEPNDMNLRLTVNSVKLKGDVFSAGDKGKVTITLTNLDTKPVDGFVRVMLYASTDNIPDAGDPVIARLARVLRIKAGGTRRLTLPLQLPGNLPPGNYTVIGEALPYRADRPAAAPDASSDPNIHVSPVVIRVARPDLVATARSTFDGKTWNAGAAGRVTVTVTNAGLVASKGAATVVAYASLDGTLTNAVEIARWDAAALNLKPGKGRTLNAAVKLPPSLAGTSWRVLAVVNPDGVFPEADLGNNTGLATGTVTVRAAA
jgi:hypothetical protein